MGERTRERDACEEVLRGNRFPTTVTPDAPLEASESHDVCVCVCREPGAALARIVELRERFGLTPILAVDATDADEFVIRALDAGADDALAMSRIGVEMPARLRAMYRRHVMSHEGGRRVPLVAGDLRIDFGMHRVWARGTELRLSPTEFRILRKLCAHAGHVVPHHVLLAEAWGEHRPEMADALRVYIRHIRRKVGAASAAVEIVSRPGIGYMLSVPS